MKDVKCDHRNFLHTHFITIIVGQNSCCKDGGEQHHLKTIFQPPGYVTPFGEFKQSESKPLSSQNCDKHPALGMTPRGYLLYKENFRLMKVQQNRAQGLGYTVTCLPIRGPYWSPNGLLPVFKKAFDLPGLRCYLKQYVLNLLAKLAASFSKVN